MLPSTLAKITLGLATTTLANLVIAGSVSANPSTTERAERILVTPSDSTGAVRALMADDEALMELRLRPHSVRSADFVLYVDDGEGPVRVEPPAPSRQDLRGDAIDQRDGSRIPVAASISSSPIGPRLRAIAIGPDRRFSISPVIAPGTPDPRFHYVTRVASRVPIRPRNPGTYPPSGTGGTPLAATGANQVLELAFDCDNAFFLQSGGTVSATLARVESLVNALDLIYTQDVAITIEVTAVVIRTTTSQPYSSSSTGGLLSQFRVHWTTVLAGIPRDTAQLLTGKPLTGEHGSALTNSICTDNAVSVAEPGFSGNFSHGVAVMAHEIAHNFGASHCNGDNDCQILCSSVNGCNGVSGFGTASINTITQNAPGFACLSDEPAVVDLPFQDSFDQTTLDTTRWMNVLGATVDSSAVGEPSAPYALRLNSAGSGEFLDDDLRSAAIDLSGASTANLRLSTEVRGAEAGEALVVEYSTGGMTWTELLRVTSDGSNQSSFTPHDIALPPGALTAETRIRLRTEADETNDAFYVDDLAVLQIDLIDPVVSNLQGTPDPLTPNGMLDVSVSASDSDSGVGSVIARIMQGPSELAQVSLSPTSGSNYAGSFPANLGLAETPHTLRVTVLDAQDNSASIETSFGVADLPLITDLLLSPAPALDDEPITASCVVSDFTGVASVTAERLLNGSGFSQIALSYDGGSGRWHGTFPATGASGNFAVTFRASDTLSNLAVPVEIQTTISPATGVPAQVGAPSVAPDPIKIGHPLLITATVTDADSPIQSVTASLEQNGVKGQATLTSSGGSLYSGTVSDTSQLAPGTVSVVVRATDLQGNLSSASSDVDAFDAPKIQTLQLSPSPLDAEDPIALSVDITDPGGIASASATISLDGEPSIEKPLAFDSPSGRYVADFPAAGHAGSLLVSVSATNIGGVSSDPFSESFPVDPTPIILLSIKADAGSVGGGTDVTLTGAGFLVDVDPGSLTVAIGGTDATQVTVIDENTLTARTPAGPEGDADVVISATKVGTPFSDSLTDGFLYGIPPTLDEVHPGGGSAFASSKLILLGQGLVGSGEPGTIEVRVGDRSTLAVTTPSDQVLIAELPPGGKPGESEDVSITTPFGTSVLTQSYFVAGVSLRDGRSTGSTHWIADIAQLDDVNSDGFFDFAVGLPQNTSAGRVRILSGDDLGTITNYSGPTNSDSFGEHLIVVADHDGDEIKDLAVADPRADIGAGNAGAVHLLSAATGQILWTATGPAGSRLGDALVSLGDLNGDGKEELLVGVPFDGPGAVYVLDGAGGSILQTLAGSDSGEEFGLVLSSRVTAEGARVAIGSPAADPGGKSDAGRVTYATLSNGTIAFTDVVEFDLDEAGAAQGSFGTRLQVALLGESPSGERLAIGLPGANLPGSGLAGSNAGRVLVIDTSDGSILIDQRGLLSGDSFGASLDATHDLDDDDQPDLLVGAPGEDSPTAADAGSIRVLSGESGDRIFERFGAGSSDHYGRRCRVLRDAHQGMVPTVAAMSDSLASRAVSLHPQHPETFCAAAFAGEKLSGKFADPRDRDGLRLEVIEGESLSFVMKPGKKNKTPVHVTLQDQDGEVILTSDPDSPFADPALAAKAGKTLKFQFDGTAPGTLFLIVGGYDSQKKQTFSLTTKRTSSSKLKIKETWIFGSSPTAQTIDTVGVPGAKVSGKITAPKKVQLDVDLFDPEMNSLAESTPTGFKASKHGDEVSLVSKKLVLTKTGTYTLSVLPESEGAVKVNVSISLPSGKGTHKQ